MLFIGLGGQESAFAEYTLVTIFILLFFIWPAEKIIGLIVLLLPNQRFFVFDIGGASMLNILIIEALFSHLIFKTSRVKILLRTQPYIFFVVMLVIYFIQYVIRYGTYEDISFAIKFLIMSMLSVLLLEKNMNRHHLINLGYLYVLGCILGAATGIINTGSFDLSIRFATNEYTSPNNTGATAAFGVAFLLTLSSIRRYNLHSTILLILLVAIGLLTQSRAFLLSMLICGFIYLCFGSVGKRGIITVFKKMTYAVSLVLIFMLLLYFTPLGGVCELAIDRVINPNRGDISGKRLFLWIFYFEQWTSSLSSFLIGIGAFDIWERLGISNTAHNFLLEAAVSYGLIGLIIILGVYISIWHRFRLIPHAGLRPMFYLPLLTAILTSLTGHSLMGMQFFFQFMISLIAFNYCVAYNKYRLEKDRYKKIGWVPSENIAT